MINRGIVIVCIIVFIFNSNVLGEETVLPKADKGQLKGLSEVSSGPTLTAQLESSEAITSDEAEIHYKRAAKLQWKQKEDALEEINQAISLNPSRAKYYDVRGQIYRNKKEYSKAISDYKKCANFHDEYESLSASCAESVIMTHCTSGDYKTGIDLINKDFDSRKEIITMWKDMYYKEDVLAVDSYIWLKIPYPPEELIKAEYKGQIGLFHAKTAVFIPVNEDSIKRIEPDARWFQVPSDKIEAPKVQVRDIFARRTIKDEAVIYLLKARCYKIAKQSDKAITELSKAINIENNEHFEILMLSERADLYTEKKQYSKAIADLSRVIKLDKTDGFFKEMALSDRGELYYNSKQLSEAVDDYQSACDMCRKRKCNSERSCESAFRVSREINRGDKWEGVGFSEDQWWYYDKTSIIRKSNRDIKVWIRTEPKYTLDAKGIFPKKANLSYELNLWHVDCLNRELGFESYLKYDSNGKVEGSENFSANATRSSVTPGTMGELIYEATCKRPDNTKAKKKKKKVAERDT